MAGIDETGKGALTRIGTAGPLHWLLVATLGYLSLPWFIFFVGWLKTPWAIGTSLLLATGLGLALADLFRDRQAARFAADWSQVLSWQGIALAVAGGVVLVAVSGVGGYGIPIGDWDKHDAILRDLVVYPWPPLYNYYGQTVGMVYYLAYYLPAAVVGKLLGFGAANQALALWTLLGVLLAIAWLSVTSRRSPGFALLVLALFSGVSLVGFLLRYYWRLDLFAQASDAQLAIGDVRLIGTWSLAWQYSSNVVQLFWVPQHALPGWIIAGVFVFVVLSSTTRRSMVLVWGLSALWSPLITVGLTPLLLADLMPAAGMRLRERLAGYVTLPNAIGFASLALMLVFYATKLAPVTQSLDQGFRIGTVFSEMERWRSPLQMLAGYVLFCLLEFGLYFAVDRFHSFRSAPEMKRHYWTTFVWLLLLPVFVFGQHNDLVMRASIPALFLVAVIVARNGFWMREVPWRRQALWLAMIVLAAVSPVHELAQRAGEIWRQGSIRVASDLPWRNLVDQFALDPAILKQYVSSIDTPFFQYAARSVPVSTAVDTMPAIVFGDSITLTGASLDRQDASPGDVLSLTLPFRAIQDVDRNYVVAVRLVGPEGTVLWEEQGWPVHTPTSTWKRARRLWYDHHAPVIPADTPPGIYRLEMYFADPETWDKMPARRITTGEALGEIMPIAWVKVGSPDFTPGSALADKAVFGGEIALLGDDLPAQPAIAPGDLLAVDLTWQAQSTPQRDYSGFVQLLNEGGQVVAQRDQVLTNGFVPPTLWSAGLTIRDRYDLSIPSTLNPGTYRLIAGIYDLATGQRLSVMTAGAPAGDWVELGQVTIGLR